MSDENPMAGSDEAGGMAMPSRSGGKPATGEPSPFGFFRKTGDGLTLVTPAQPDPMPSVVDEPEVFQHVAPEAATMVVEGQPIEPMVSPVSAKAEKAAAAADRKAADKLAKAAAAARKTADKAALKAAGGPAASKKGSASVEEDPLPLLVSIDYYRGYTKANAAEALARSFIEKNFDAPNASFFYVQKWRDGLAVEMQMGGGKAYLPEVLAKLDEDESSVVAATMSNRVMTVRFDDHSKKLECLMLTEGMLPPPDAFIARPTKPMNPYDKRGSRVFVMGIGVFIAGIMALLFSFGSFFLDVDTWALPKLATTRVKDLPTSQMAAINTALKSGECVAKMEFTGGRWSVTPGYDVNGQCSARPGNNAMALAAPTASVIGPDGVAVTMPVPGQVAPGTVAGTGPGGAIPVPGAAPGVAPAASSGPAMPAMAPAQPSMSLPPPPPPVTLSSGTPAPVPAPANGAIPLPAPAGGVVLQAAPAPR